VNPPTINSGAPKSVTFVEWRDGPKSQRAAFTLIELVTVMAIIAVLAMILLPVLMRAKGTALTVQCLNNMKDLQRSYHLYVNENNGYLPLNFIAGSSGGRNSWVSGNAQIDVTTTNIQHGLLYQYSQNPLIYACPANTHLIRVTTPPPGSGLKPSQLVPQVRTCSIDYSLGANSVGSPNGPWTISRNGLTWNSYQKFSQIQSRIAQKIVFADEAQWNLDDCAFGLFPLTSSPPINVWWNLPGNRHNNGAVWSFADGHCEYWKWHGSVVNTLIYQTSYSGSGDIPGDTSDDLARTEAGGAQFP